MHYEINEGPVYIILIPILLLIIIPSIKMFYNSLQNKRNTKEEDEQNHIDYGDFISSESESDLMVFF